MLEVMPCALTSRVPVVLVMVFLLGSSFPVVAQWSLLEPDPELMGYTNFLGQGLSFVDFNLDGWDDLTVTNSSGELAFYEGGATGLTAVDLGIAPSYGRPISVMWLDIDNDGDRDFLCSSGMGVSIYSGLGQVSRSEVWINEAGTFVDRTSEWGFDVLANHNCMGMAFHDFDEDGDLDVMIPVYSLPCEGSWMGQNFFFEHGGDSFVDRSVSSGIANGEASSFQAGWLDLNGDSLIDFLLIQDAGIEIDCVEVNEAYVNNGDGTFTESGNALGLDVSMASMSITLGDPDQDGEEEVFITNQEMSEFYPYPMQTSGFFDRSETGQWVEQAEEVGLDGDRWSWSALWVDMDLDGAEELLAATSLFSIVGGEFMPAYANHLYRRSPELTGADLFFEEDTTEWPGWNLSLHSIIRGDLDGDGDPDGVGMGAGPLLTRWVNEVEATHPQNHWLNVSVCGTHSNSEAIGTKMVLHAGGHRQQRTLRAGEDLFVQHSTTQFFGLGESTMADSLEVFWPNGARTVRYALQGDSAYRFVQAEEEVAIALGEQVGDSITLNLTLPPKWTGVEWNGEATSQTSTVVAVGDPVSGRALWFGGLYSVDFEVDWSALSESASGCTVSIADNYDPQAETDDGSCTYHGLCGEGAEWSVLQQQCIPSGSACAEDLDGDDLVGVTDVLLILSMYGESCAEDTE